MVVVVAAMASTGNDGSGTVGSDDGYCSTDGLHLRLIIHLSLLNLQFHLHQCNLMHSTAIDSPFSSFQRRK